MHVCLPLHWALLAQVLRHTPPEPTSMHASGHLPLAMSWPVVFAAQPQSECIVQLRVQTPFRLQKPPERHEHCESMLQADPVQDDGPPPDELEQATTESARTNPGPTKYFSIPPTSGGLVAQLERALVSSAAPVSLRPVTAGEWCRSS
jgi:hypothetical protein